MYYEFIRDIIWTLSAVSGLIVGYMLADALGLLDFKEWGDDDEDKCD